MKTVFISRQLKADSIFYKKLSNTAFEVSGKSLITFQSVDFKYTPTTEWIFFYSKNAIIFFFKNIQKHRLPFDKNAFKWATIGKGTAEQLRKHHIEPDFVGTGKPDETAFLFLKKAKNKTVTFPQATTSQQSIQKLLGHQIKGSDLIVYQNKPLKLIESRREDILIFTSPMNAITYFEKYPLKNHQQIISIGQTTEKALKQLGYNHIIVSETPTEEGLVQAVLDMTILETKE